jgi:GDPmannose 4,6-dehydratase
MGHDMTAPKIALISGVTGQDGAYLAKFLLDKGYEVHGIKRRTSSFNTSRIDPIYQDPHEASARFFLHYGDLTDSLNLLRIVQETQPDEIYNLGAQSHVHVSFETPEYTANTDAIGTLRLLEAIRILGLEKKTRFYQASTSEMFGQTGSSKQSESTPFRPASPYATAKVYGFWTTVNYRESYGIHASNGILFNHESPLRGETFVTRKITRGVARIKYGLDNCIWLGNLDARRDWGHAREYVEAMWLMLQDPLPDDYVIATGKSSSVRDFLKLAFTYAGINLEFKGRGTDEIGINQATGQTVVRIDPRYLRPSEVPNLSGDSSKAALRLGWKAKIPLENLCREMVLADIYRIQKQLRMNHVGDKSVAAVASDSGGFLQWLDQNPGLIEGFDQ